MPDTQIDATALEAATKRIYEDKGDRKGVLYVGWEAEPEEVKEQWREDVRVSIEAYLAALAGHVVVPISGWRDIASAPKDGERILLGFSGSMSAEGYWHDGSSNYREQDGWYFADDDVLTGRPCNPDCWQPLPIPPVSRGE